MHRNISCNFCYIPGNDAESTPPVPFLAGIGKKKGESCSSLLLSYSNLNIEYDYIYKDTTKY